MVTCIYLLFQIHFIAWIEALKPTAPPTQVTQAPQPTAAAPAPLLCDAPYECVGQSVLTTDGNININGYKAAFGPTTTLADDAQYLMCAGAFSCKEVSTIVNHAYTTCKSTHSCSHTTIDSTDAVQCYGRKSCLFSNITTSGATPDIWCDGEQSCAHSRIHGERTIHGTGTHALYSATILSSALQDSLLELTGKLAGYGATFTCRAGHTCTISCLGYDSCYMLYADCVGNCIINAAGTIAPITNINDLEVVDIDAEDGSAHTTSTDEMCNTHPNALTYDSKLERVNADIIVQAGNEGPICCRGREACAVSTIQYVVANNEAVVCSGGWGCKTADIDANGASVYCESADSCKFAQIHRPSHLYCSAFIACKTSTVTSSRYITCSGKESCTDSTIYSAGSDLDLDFMGQSAGLTTTIYCNATDWCNIRCIGYASCTTTTVVCEGSCNIYCGTESHCPIGWTSSPTGSATNAPTSFPTANTIAPTYGPTAATTFPTGNPTLHPTNYPTNNPSNNPTSDPSNNPSNDPSTVPTNDPTSNPSNNPTRVPSNAPTVHPSMDPTTSAPTKIDETLAPTNAPTTATPTTAPTLYPTDHPTVYPTNDPTMGPTSDPTVDPTMDPTIGPTVVPTAHPTVDPTVDPTMDPTPDPTTDPTMDPTVDPTIHPTLHPTKDPTRTPNINPSIFASQPALHPLNDNEGRVSVEVTASNAESVDATGDNAEQKVNDLPSQWVVGLTVGVVLLIGINCILVATVRYYRKRAHRQWAASPDTETIGHETTGTVESPGSGTVDTNAPGSMGTIQMAPMKRTSRLQRVASVSGCGSDYADTAGDIVTAAAVVVPLPDIDGDRRESRSIESMYNNPQQDEMHRNTTDGRMEGEGGEGATQNQTKGDQTTRGAQEIALAAGAPDVVYIPSDTKTADGYTATTAGSTAGI